MPKWLHTPNTNTEQLRKLRKLNTHTHTHSISIVIQVKSTISKQRTCKKGSVSVFFSSSLLHNEIYPAQYCLQTGFLTHTNMKTAKRKEKY